MQKLFQYIDENQLYGLTTEGFQWVHRGEGMVSLKNDPECILKEPPRSFIDIRHFLYHYDAEGLVYTNGEQQCEVLRSDFGLPWPDAEGLYLEFDMPLEAQMQLISFAAEEGMTFHQWLFGHIENLCNNPERLKVFKEQYEKNPDESVTFEATFYALKPVPEEMKREGTQHEKLGE